VKAETIRNLAVECGLDLAGVTPAVPLPEWDWYKEWAEMGMAGEMTYLTDHRAGIRADPRALLHSARSIVCVGKLYQGPGPSSVPSVGHDNARIARYAWGPDYHIVLRSALQCLVDNLLAAGAGPFDWRICVDTAPLMERAYARRAALGWIGKNSCLINQGVGSWLLLGELLLSLEIEPDALPPDRCGRCTRCIDACPTGAILPSGCCTGPSHAVDSRRCISYLTNELRGAIPEPLRPALAGHVFGCDICQQVCPWNRRPPSAGGRPSDPARFHPRLEWLAGLSEKEYRRLFGASAVNRLKYPNLLRNLAVAMGNSGDRKYRKLLGKLARMPGGEIASHARWALERLE